MLLDGGQFRERAFHAEVAAGDHDDVSLGQDAVEIVDGLLAFELDTDRHAPAAGFDEFLGFADIVRGLHVRDSDSVHAELHAVTQIALVLFCQGTHPGGLAGQGEALAGGYHALVFGFEDHEAVGAASVDKELKPAVCQNEAVSLDQSFQNHVVVKGEIGHFRGIAAGRAEKELHALGDLNALFPDVAEADFGAGKILHDGQRDAEFLFHGADAVDDADEILGAAVGEIEAEYPDTGLGKIMDFFPRVGGRSYGRNNFCPVHFFSFLSAFHPEDAALPP